jgi:membrane protein YqaA with SNARE-associated domain
MSKPAGDIEYEGFLNLLKSSWIKSSIKLGIFFAIVGLITLFLMIYFHMNTTPMFSSARAFATGYGLLGIFLATVVAGTIVPLGSPALVVAAAFVGVPKIPLILAASVGFTVGMMINYGLAYRFGRPYIMKKISSERLEDIVRLWNRWGWILFTLFGLIPVLPVELLSLVCGLLKTRVWTFLFLSFLPRLVIFTVLAYFGGIVSGWV